MRLDLVLECWQSFLFQVLSELSDDAVVSVTTKVVLLQFGTTNVITWTVIDSLQTVFTYGNKAALTPRMQVTSAP